MSDETKNLLRQHPELIDGMLNISSLVRFGNVKRGTPKENDPCVYYTPYGEARYTLKELKMFILCKDSKLGKVFYGI